MMYQKTTSFIPFRPSKEISTVDYFPQCFIAVEIKIYYLRIFLRMTDNTIMLPVIRKPLEFTKIIEKVSPTSI